MEMAMYMAHHAHEVGMKAEDDSDGGFGEGGEEGFKAEGAGSLGFGFGQGLRGLWQAQWRDRNTYTLSWHPRIPAPLAVTQKSTVSRRRAVFALEIAVPLILKSHVH